MINTGAPAVFHASPIEPGLLHFPCLISMRVEEDPFHRDPAPGPSLLRLSLSVWELIDGLESS
jgi:hypothetical protein